MNGESGLEAAGAANRQTAAGAGGGRRPGVGRNRRQLRQFDRMRPARPEAPAPAIFVSRGRPLGLPGLGELDLDPQLNLGQYGIEARIAGGGFQVGGGIAQPAHHGMIEIAG